MAVTISSVGTCQPADTLGVLTTEFQGAEARMAQPTFFLKSPATAADSGVLSPRLDRGRGTRRSRRRTPRRTHRHRGLIGDLSRAVKDGQVRRGVQKAQAWPHKKREKPSGEPKIQSAASEQRRAAKRVKAKHAAPSWTALHGAQRKGHPSKRRTPFFNSLRPPPLRSCDTPQLPCQMSFSPPGALVQRWPFRARAKVAR
jgi:hypothetical protein